MTPINPDERLEQVRRLWAHCFSDGPDFVALYFRLRYRDSNTLTVDDGQGRVLSAMQLLPYPMTYLGHDLRTEYVSGACTHPDYRRRGLMSGLLTDALHVMRSRGTAMATLIPAHSGLFAYYARLGFATAFHTGGQLVRPGAATADEGHVVYASADDREAYRYLCREQRRRPCAVLHTEDDWAVICADLELCDGRVATLRSATDGGIEALAVVYPMASGSPSATGRTYRVEELPADSPRLADRLLRLLARDLMADTFIVGTRPIDGARRLALGMARIVDVPTVLRLFAATHTAAHHRWHVVDPQLAANTAYYDIADGHCRVSVHRPTDAAAYTVATPADLVAVVLRPHEPSMTLMLN